VTWHGNGTMSYQTRKEFKFAPELSSGHQVHTQTNCMRKQVACANKLHAQTSCMRKQVAYASKLHMQVSYKRKVVIYTS
jgi:hypothetical protein